MRLWYAVQSKPRQKRVALENLLRQHYAAYLRQCAQRKLTRGRHHSVTAPLFPGYLFVELDLDQDNTAPIRSTIGCTGLVRFGTRAPQHRPRPLVHREMCAAYRAAGVRPAPWSVYPPLA